MGEILNELFKQAPEIIDRAAQKPLGLAALSVLVLGTVGFLLFREAAGKAKLLALAMITGGFLGFMALVLVLASDPNPATSLPKSGTSEAQIEQIIKEQTKQIRNQAAAKLENGKHLSFKNDQARADLDEALALFNKVDDRLGRRGQANALRGLGDLESKLGRNDQARAAYGDALALFRQEDDLLGQANVLSGLGSLVSRENPQRAAAYFRQSAWFYLISDKTEAYDAASREADKLSKK